MAKARKSSSSRSGTKKKLSRERAEKRAQKKAVLDDFDDGEIVLIMVDGNAVTFLIGFKITGTCYCYRVEYDSLLDEHVFELDADGRHIKFEGATPALETPDIYRPWRRQTTMEGGLEFDPLLNRK